MSANCSRIVSRRRFLANSAAGAAVTLAVPAVLTKL
ncbi:MAG: twin-arginine translocation signal domain-containing protein [Planctomycetes bacterium]|nr:twin-arginine translocation signal domain-containing protein [Planctomycetota bacterium]